MNIDDDERRYLWVPAVCTADLAGATAVLEIDATQYAMSWDGNAAQSGSSWTRLARTVKTFIGSSLTPGGNDVQLTAGRHLAQQIVTLADGQTVAGPQQPIDVS